MTGMQNLLSAVQPVLQLGIIQGQKTHGSRNLRFSKTGHPEYSAFERTVAGSAAVAEIFDRGSFIAWHDKLSASGVGNGCCAGDFLSVPLVLLIHRTLASTAEGTDRDGCHDPHEGNDRQQLDQAKPTLGSL